jgi:hypothetical protein
MLTRKCINCQRLFQTDKGYYHTCPECYRQENPIATEPCHAVNQTGTNCQRKACKGQVFCSHHYKTYGIFSLLVHRKSIHMGTALEVEIENIEKEK